MVFCIIMKDSNNKLLCHHNSKSCTVNVMKESKENNLQNYLLKTFFFIIKEASKDTKTIKYYVNTHYMYQNHGR